MNIILHYLTVVINVKLMHGITPSSRRNIGNFFPNDRTIINSIITNCLNYELCYTTLPIFPCILVSCHLNVIILNHFCQPVLPWVTQTIFVQTKFVACDIFGAPLLSIRTITYHTLSDLGFANMANRRSPSSRYPSCAMQDLPVLCGCGRTVGWDFMFVPEAIKIRGS